MCERTRMTQRNNLRSIAEKISDATPSKRNSTKRLRRHLWLYYLRAMSVRSVYPRGAIDAASNTIHKIFPNCAEGNVFMSVCVFQNENLGPCDLGSSLFCR